MISYKSPDEIKTMKQGGKILDEILNTLKNFTKAGLNAGQVEEKTEELIKKAGARPSFKNYKSKKGKIYPNCLCLCLNQEVVHCLPGADKIIADDDLVSLDLGIWVDGLNAGTRQRLVPAQDIKNRSLCLDSAISFTVGLASPEAQKIINVTREALRIAILKCRVGNYIADISQSIQRYAESQGYNVIRDLVGHGVGYEVHEDPQIPNFFPFDKKNPRNKGPKLKEGMVLAIEPMICAGHYKLKKSSDKFGVETADGQLSCHFEHTVAITKKGPMILTE